MTEQLDNKLVDQKNHILNLVNDDKFEEALALLDFIAPLWSALSYAYKTREIRERIRREVSDKVAQSDHWKTEQKWERMLERIPC